VLQFSGKLLTGQKNDSLELLSFQAGALHWYLLVNVKEAGLSVVEKLATVVDVVIRLGVVLGRGQLLGKVQVFDIILFVWEVKSVTFVPVKVVGKSSFTFAPSIRHRIFLYTVPHITLLAARGLLQLLPEVILLVMVDVTWRCFPRIFEDIRVRSSLSVMPFPGIEKTLRPFDV